MYNSFLNIDVKMRGIPRLSSGGVCYIIRPGVLSHKYLYANIEVLKTSWFCVHVCDSVLSVVIGGLNDEAAEFLRC